MVRYFELDHFWFVVTKSRVMKMPTQTDAFKETLSSAAKAVGLVGAELQTFLSRELLSKLVLRKGRDVVLLTGPTGAGKEMVSALAHKLAELSLNRTGRLVELNCANLGANMFESQLFGYRRGAFTGADRDFEGFACQAKGGTLVLDEFQSLPLEDQAKLLRFLGEREYRPLGSTQTKQCDAIIVLASNQQLDKLVEAGSFRRDLLDRAPAKITLPPLYERKGDVAELAQKFALEAGHDLEAEEFYGLTRRAKADVEAAVIQSGEISVRKLREIIRDAVFTLAVDGLGEAIESHQLEPSLTQHFRLTQINRALVDQAQVEENFDLLVSRVELEKLAQDHEVTEDSLHKLCSAIHSLIDDLDEGDKHYRRVSERTHRLSKVALWLVSGAKTQAEFRRFFGSTNFEMPTKSVAHQIYHEVYGRGA